MKAMSYNSCVHENLLVPRCLQKCLGAVLLQQCKWTWITEVYVSEVLTYCMSVCSEQGRIAFPYRGKPCVLPPPKHRYYLVQKNKILFFFKECKFGRYLVITDALPKIFDNKWSKVQS